MLLLAALAACSVTPKPISSEQRADQVASLLQRYAAGQEPVSAPIDMYSAMARAIKYNLDYRVAIMEQTLRRRDVDLQRFEMLPRFVASVDYNGRSNDSGGFSRSLLSGNVSLEPSTSSDRETTNSDLTLSWDVLDFGLSYVRANQLGDEALAADERKRKVIDRIIEDVRTAFWRAVSAERLQGKLRELERVTQAALEQAQEQRRSGLTRPLPALTYERELLTIRRDAQVLARELSMAKQQLAALMNLPPDQPFQLSVPSQLLRWDMFDMPYEQMLRNAIKQRPELREVAYQMRSNERETQAAMLRALPNLKLFMGADWSSNSYLYNNNWGAWGARASWNLLNVFRVGSDRERVATQGQLLDARALALTMAVATQVSIGRARYELRLRELDTAERFLQVQQRIEEQIEVGFKADSVSRQTLIREQMNTVLAQVRQDMAVADLQNAYANVFAAMGVDPIDVNMSSNDSVAVLAGKLRKLWFERGDALAKPGQS